MCAGNGVPRLMPPSFASQNIASVTRTRSCLQLLPTETLPFGDQISSWHNKRAFLFALTQMANSESVALPTELEVRINGFLLIELIVQKYNSSIFNMRQCFFYAVRYINGSNTKDRSVQFVADWSAPIFRNSFLPICHSQY